MTEYHYGIGFNNAMFDTGYLQHKDFEIIEADLGLNRDDDQQVDGFEVVHLKATQFDAEANIPITNEIADGLQLCELQVSYRMDDEDIQETLSSWMHKEGQQFWVAPRNPAAMQRAQERLHAWNLVSQINTAATLKSLDRIMRSISAEDMTFDVTHAYGVRRVKLERRERQAAYAREAYEQKRIAQEAEAKKLATVKANTMVLIKVGNAKKVVTMHAFEKTWKSQGGILLKTM